MCYTVRGGMVEGWGSSGRLLQAKVPVWFQILLMEIPHAPSRSGFGCMATGPQVPPPGRAGVAGNCSAFCLMSPLRTEHSDWCPRWGQTPSFTTMSQGAPAVSLPGALLSFVFIMHLCHFCFFGMFYGLSGDHISPWPSFLLLLVHYLYYLHIYAVPMIIPSISIYWLSLVFLSLKEVEENWGSFSFRNNTAETQKRLFHLLFVKKRTFIAIRSYL